MERDSDYTERFANYTADDARRHNRKFSTSFEKNIKQCQEVDFINKYVHHGMKWLDAPIGGGRLTPRVHAGKRFGMDISPAFVRQNSAQGTPCVVADLFNIPFLGEFDLITSLHTVSSFASVEPIIREYVGALSADGILIVDLVNKRHRAAAAYAAVETVPCFDREDIVRLFDGLGCDVLEIRPHDYYDNLFYRKWRRSGDRRDRERKVRLWGTFTKLYFRFGLRGLLSFYSRLRGDAHHNKFLVAARKRPA
jgi:Methyltransferase domain